jgi:hypothetical protein
MTVVLPVLKAPNSVSLDFLVDAQVFRLRSQAPGDDLRIGRRELSSNLGNWTFAQDACIEGVVGVEGEEGSRASGMQSDGLHHLFRGCILQVRLVDMPCCGGDAGVCGWIVAQNLNLRSAALLSPHFMLARLSQSTNRVYVDFQATGFGRANVVVITYRFAAKYQAFAFQRRVSCSKAES